MRTLIVLGLILLYLQGALVFDSYRFRQLCGDYGGPVAKAADRVCYRVEGWVGRHLDACAFEERFNAWRDDQ